MLTAEPITDRWANPTLRVRPTTVGNGPVAMARSEQVVCFAVVFLLIYNVPTTWFTGAGEPGSTGSPTQMTLLCLAGVGYGLTRSRFEIGPIIQAIRQEFVLPGLVMLILTSALWSSDVNHTMRDGIMFVLLSLFGYWMATRFTIGSIVGLVATVCAVGTMLQLFMIRVYPWYAATGDTWVGTFKDKNIFGRHLSFALVVLMLASRIHRRWRFPIYAVMVLDAILLLRSQSSTALVAAVTTPAMALVFVAFRARRTLYGAVAVAVPLAIAAAVGLVVANLGSLTERLGRNATFTGRTDIWRAVWEEAQHRPALGFGWMGFFTDDVNGPAKYVYLKVLKVPHAHNALLDMFVMLGYVGAGLMALLFVRLLIRGARVIRYYRGAAGLFPIVYTAYAVVSSVTEFGVFRVDAHFLLLVVAVVGAQPGRRDQLDRSGAREYARLLAGSTPLPPSALPPS